MEDDNKYYFYAYVTRHGVYSETAVLHVGYQHGNENTYPTWFSDEPVDEDVADAVYERIRHLDGSRFIGRSEAADIIKDVIADELEKRKKGKR